MKKLFSIMFFALVVGIILWISNVFAQGNETWGPIKKVVEPVKWYEIISYLGFLFMIICFFVALFKKVSWFWLCGILLMLCISAYVSFCLAFRIY